MSKVVKNSGKYQNDQEDYTGSGAATWGSITGTLSSQTDLNTELSNRTFYSKTLTSDFSTSNTSAQNTGLKFSIGANERWNVIISGSAAKAGATTGLRIAIAGPTGATMKGTEFRGQAATSTALQNTFLTAINTLGATFATGNGVEVPFRVEFTILSSSTAGDVELQLATVTSNTATIYAGTFLLAFRIN